MNNYISINNQRIDLTEEQVEKIRSSFNLPVTKVAGIKLADVPVGEVVKIGDHEMIVLEHIAGATMLIRKDLLKDDQEFGANNNYDGSYVDAICQEFAKEIAAIVGEDNIILHDVDLTSDDGLKDYGTIQRFASLLTTEQYRRYVEILDKYKLDAWWWLATPWSTPTHGNSSAIKCVSPSGGVNNGLCNGDGGVRPILILKSTIFESSEV